MLARSINHRWNPDPAEINRGLPPAPMGPEFSLQAWWISRVNNISNYSLRLGKCIPGSHSFPAFTVPHIFKGALGLLGLRGCQGSGWWMVLRSLFLHTLQHIQGFIIPLEPRLSFVINDRAVAEVIARFTSPCPVQEQSTKCFLFSFTQGVSNKLGTYFCCLRQWRENISLFVFAQIALIASWKVHFIKGKTHLKVELVSSSLREIEIAVFVPLINFPGRCVRCSVFAHALSNLDLNSYRMSI